MRLVGKAALVMVLMLTPVVTGAVGYYLGLQGRASAAPVAPTYKTWVDSEITATGTQGMSILKCSWHLADGRVVVQSKVFYGTAQPRC